MPSLSYEIMIDRVIYLKCKMLVKEKWTWNVKHVIECHSLNYRPIDADVFPFSNRKSWSLLQELSSFHQRILSYCFGYFATTLHRQQQQQKSIYVGLHRRGPTRDRQSIGIGQDFISFKTAAQWSTRQSIHSNPTTHLLLYMKILFRFLYIRLTFWCIKVALSVSLVRSFQLLTI